VLFEIHKNDLLSSSWPRDEYDILWQVITEVICRALSPSTNAAASCAPITAIRA
jgi:predicted 3-demethylubiquinone-9 3-methyltransferase (glyoxalase superfamily)